MALDVQEAAEELEIYKTSIGEDSSISDRRISHRFAQSKSHLRSANLNGVDSGFYDEEHKLSESFQKEVQTLKMGKKKKKDEFDAALKIGGRSSPDEKIVDDPDFLDKASNNLDQVCSSGHFLGKEEMELSLQKYEKDLMEVNLERNKALEEVTRLKLHLLEKEVEELEKMDEDSRIIEELRAESEHQRAQISHFANTLKQAMASQEEVKKTNNNELQKAKETISDLKQKLASCMSTVDAKNFELLNLQTALGQYCAESKEHLERYLTLAREESFKLSESLKDANQRVEVSRQEKEEILGKLSQAERMISEGKHRVEKAEEDNTKLRHALEQSMTRLNRLSMDSNYFVDRRIVIKLLVAYFQGNHSKEVLDVMVRMLEFSEEDKQKIGVAQQGGGKGVVRRVFGLPGRLVGGIFGGGSPESHNHVPSENQSFADMWVDFLLKETEEREGREDVEATGVSKDNPQGRSTSSTKPTVLPTRY